MLNGRKLIRLTGQFGRRYCSIQKQVDLTEKRYKVLRGNYAILNDVDVQFFEKLIGQQYVLRNPEEVEKFNVDYLRSVRGRSEIVLKPKTSIQIAEILKYCNGRKLAVCPQGGNTGLVGGSVPVFDEIVISLENLNTIYSVDEITGIMMCDAGCILENLDKKAREMKLILPLDLGAKYSCQIGGNISTNAGGLRVLRYGNLHGSILGVEAVLASGKILDLMSNFKKDNTGYHLKHLFIGSEGTLGIVTKCAILCPPKSKSINLAFLGLSSFEAVLKTFQNAKQNLGEILSACEMIDEVAYTTSINAFNLNPPLQNFPFYMLIETSGSNENHDMEKITNFLNYGMDRGEIMDGTYTGEISKMNAIWKIREMVPVSLQAGGYCFKYDISLPLRDFYNIVLKMRERLKHLPVQVSGYGHIGDSNLHLNVACKEFTHEIYKTIEPFVYQYTSELKGSVSAEHGIGFLKTSYLPYSKSDKAISMMKNVKNMLDPHGILNPYKVLPL